MVTVMLISFPLLLAFAATQAHAAFTDASSIQSFLQANFSNTNSGMVIALLDESGAKIFHSGKLDHGTDQEINADTLFEIGSSLKPSPLC